MARKQRVTSAQGKKSPARRSPRAQGAGSASSVDAASETAAEGSSEDQGAEAPVEESGEDQSVSEEAIVESDSASEADAAGLAENSAEDDGAFGAEASALEQSDEAEHSSESGPDAAPAPGLVESEEELDAMGASESHASDEADPPPQSGSTSVPPPGSGAHFDVPSEGEDDGYESEFSGGSSIVGFDGEGLEEDEAPAEDTEQFLKGLVEAILFVADKPMSAREVARTAQIDRARAEELIKELVQETKGRGVRLVAVSEGYAFRTNAAYAGYVRGFLAQKPVRLSRAQLETLAIVAYRQPVTRPEIDDVRGVDSGAVLKTLLERDLVRVLGKKDEPGRPMLYGTTPEFLDLFSLKSLRDLPTLREFTELTEESREKFEAELGEAAPLGPILLDEEVRESVVVETGPGAEDVVPESGEPKEESPEEGGEASEAQADEEDSERKDELAAADESDEEDSDDDDEDSDDDGSDDEDSDDDEDDEDEK